MSRFAHQSLAAVAAVFIVVATWTPVITVPQAQATETSVVLVPTLA